MSQLEILHFNDVYRVTPQKVPGGTMDVTQFLARVDSLRTEEQKKNGLFLFSGDVFSPSVESTVTRGSHMVPVINEILPDVALTGNHDFDFGYPHLSKLVQDCKFPWILSNIIDSETDKVPEHLKEFEVFERAGVRIGVIGLVEKDWIDTVSAWPPNFKFKSMDDVGVELSKLLRDPDGEHKCDIVICLTHSRLPNDIKLAKSLGARFSPDPSQHGVDLILGGHDHLYYVGKAITEWEDYEVDGSLLGAEGDDGVLIIKSGSDFRDLSSMVLELEDRPEGSVRRKVISKVTGKRHTVNPGDPSSERLAKLIKDQLSSVTDALKAAICRAVTPLDVRSGLVRTDESAAGNWFADVLRHAYDEALCIKGGKAADGVLICGGTLRGDSVYGPGVVTLGDIMEILPFQDAIVVIEVDGETLWAALESALSPWPAQEGRFPILSGFVVEWNSKNEPGQRVLGVWQADEDHDHDESETVKKGEEVKREKGGRIYRIVTRDYMATGHDGYEPLKGSTFVVDEENGMTMMTIVRRYLLGSQYIQIVKSLTKPPSAHLSSHTEGAIDRARSHRPSAPARTGSATSDKWKDVARKALKHSKEHIGDALNVGGREHMTGVDCFDGRKARTGQESEKDEWAKKLEEDLITIKPAVDGRLLDKGREK